VQSRIASVALAAVSLLFLVDLFLPWSRSGLDSLTHDRTNAWETGPGIFAGAFAALVFAWEAARVAGFSSTLRADGYIAFAAGTTAALLGAATLITIATDGFYSAELAYGSWIGLGLCVVMVTASLARLLEHRSLT
jgi:hypothetical protein